MRGARYARRIVAGSLAAQKGGACYARVRGAGPLRASVASTAAHVLYLAAMKRGQTMVEYLLVMVLLMSAALSAGWITRAINAQRTRTQMLLGSDYP